MKFLKLIEAAFSFAFYKPTVCYRRIYNDKVILKESSFTLDQGIYGLLGRKGVGKTTLLKAILGLINIDSGSISILKSGSIKDNINLLRNVGVTIEIPKHHLHLSAKENLSIHLSYLNYFFEERNNMTFNYLKK